MARLKSIIKLIRVYQWTKSGFIFLPFVFSDKLHGFFKDPLGPGALADMSRLLLAFFGFSFLASAGYILNDWKDVELDRLDPKKRLRPLASGALSPAFGLFIALLLLGASTAMAFQLSFKVTLAFIFYLLINTIFYSLLGKRIILLDVFIIAVGFVLRVFIGAFALDIEASPWLLSCTFFIALFLGFSKRFYEIRSGSVEELVGGAYNVDTLQSFISISAGLAIMNYSMYCILGRHASAHLIWSVPFVVLGIFRYYVISHESHRNGNPSDVLLSDKFLMLNIFIWLVLCAGLILFFQG